MDKRYILSVSLVTSSWTFSGTHANNMTTMASNMTTSHANNMTTMASNMTTSHANNMTTMANNMTTSHANNMTTMASNMTTSHANNMTTMGGNVAASNSANMSTASSTQPPTVSPNNTVEPLEENISNTGCGSQQSCVAEPSKCNPAKTGSCFFSAAKRQNGRNFFFDLAGESDGYIAATVTGGSAEGNPTFICAKSKGAVKFFSALLKDDNLTISELPVNSVKGKATGRKIECSFLASVPEPRRARRATGTTMSVSTGEFNDTNDSSGAPTPVIRATVDDSGNPNTTVTNEISSNTTTNATTAASGTVIPALQASISRDECGSTKSCAAEPSECDPASGDCYFLSAQQQSGQTYDFESSGQSDGYVAAGVSASTVQSGRHDAYICANNNGSVIFFTGTLNNFELSLKESNSSNRRGTVSNGKIQCIFTAELPDSSTRAAFYASSVSTGSYDSNSQESGPATFRISTNRANLSDPNANLTNLVNNGTTDSASFSSMTPTHSFLPVSSVTVCMSAFTAM